MGRVSLACLGAAVAFVMAPAGAMADKDEHGTARHAGGEVVYSKKEHRYKHKEGEYGGVTPGVVYPYADQHFKRRIKRHAPKHLRKRTLYWIGFQAKQDHSARMFLQLGAEPTFRQMVTNSTLYIHVEGIHYRNRNARRRIETHHFDTAVLMITSKRVGHRRAYHGKPGQKAGVLFTITFKNPADAHEAATNVAVEKDGYTYLYFDFGPPTPVSEETGHDDN